MRMTWLRQLNLTVDLDRENKHRKGKLSDLSIMGIATPGPHKIYLKKSIESQIKTKITT